jgi:hypothetical protein
MFKFSFHKIIKKNLHRKATRFSVALREEDRMKSRRSTDGETITVPLVNETVITSDKGFSGVFTDVTDEKEPSSVSTDSESFQLVTTSRRASINAASSNTVLALSPNPFGLLSSLPSSFSQENIRARFDFASSDKMASVRDYINANRVDQAAVDNAFTEVVDQIDRHYEYKCKEPRSAGDNGLVRSVEHDIRETTQVIAWSLEYLAFGKAPWGLHYSRKLFQLMTVVGEMLATLGFGSNMLAHIQDTGLEKKPPEQYVQHKSFTSFFTNDKNFVSKGRRSIDSFDNETIIKIPICYGFLGHLTGIELQNTINGWLEIFAKQNAKDNEKYKLGASNLEIFLGLFDGLDVPIEGIEKEGQVRLDVWNEQNQKWLELKGVKVKHFDELAQSPFYIAAKSIMDIILVTKTAKVAHAIQNDITSYLEKVSNRKGSGISFLPRGVKSKSDNKGRNALADDDANNRLARLSSTSTNLSPSSAETTPLTASPVSPALTGPEVVASSSPTNIGANDLGLGVPAGEVVRNGSMMHKAGTSPTKSSFVPGLNNVAAEVSSTTTLFINGLLDRIGQVAAGSDSDSSNEDNPEEERKETRRIIKGVRPYVVAAQIAGLLENASGAGSNPLAFFNGSNGNNHSVQAAVGDTVDHQVQSAPSSPLRKPNGSSSIHRTSPIKQRPASTIISVTSDTSSNGNDHRRSPTQ